MAEKTTKKAITAKVETEKKTRTCATRAKKAATVIYVNAQNAGFRAGDVYQLLAKAEAPMTVAEVAKAAKLATEDVYLGIGWLLKEGKVTSTEDNKIVLA